MAPHREDSLNSISGHMKVPHICLVLRSANHTSFHANILNINIYSITVYTIYNCIYTVYIICHILYILYNIQYSIYTI